MTGGRVVVLGRTGSNFGAGMSGGIAFVYNIDGDFEKRCNKQLVSIEEVSDKEDISELREMIENHYKYTKSSRAEKILDNFDSEIKKFVKIIPFDYKKVINEIKKCVGAGMSEEDAKMEAFEAVIGEKQVCERSAVNG